MRFLLALPLPLLLILCSDTAFYSTAPPNESNELQGQWSKTRRIRRSATDPSEGGTNNTAYYDSLSLEEVTSLLKLAGDLINLAKEDMENAQKAVANKEKEIEMAKGDYEGKKREFEKWKDLDDWKKAAIAAGYNVNELSGTISTLNTTIEIAEETLVPLIKKVEDAKQVKEDLNNIDKTIESANSEVGRWKGLVDSQEQTVNGLNTTKGTMKTKYLEAQGTLSIYIDLFETQDCIDQAKAKKSPCTETIENQNKYKVELFKAEQSLNETIIEHTNAVKHLRELKIGMTSANNTLETWKNKKKAITDSKNEADKALKEAETNLAVYEEPLNEMKEAMQKAEEDLKKAIDAKKEAEDKIAGAPSDAKAKLAASYNEQSKAGEKIPKLEGELPNLRKIFEEKQKILNEKEAQVAALQHQVDKRKASKGGTSIGLIVGSIVGGVLLLVIMAIVVLVIYRKHKERRLIEKFLKNPDCLDRQYFDSAHGNATSRSSSATVNERTPLLDSAREKPQPEKEKEVKFFTTADELPAIVADLARQEAKRMARGPIAMDYDGSIRFMIDDKSGWWFSSNGVSSRPEFTIFSFKPEKLLNGTFNRIAETVASAGWALSSGLLRARLVMSDVRVIFIDTKSVPNIEGRRQRAGGEQETVEEETPRLSARERLEALDNVPVGRLASFGRKLATAFWSCLYGNHIYKGLEDYEKIVEEMKRAEEMAEEKAKRMERDLQTAVEASSPPRECGGSEEPTDLQVETTQGDVTGGTTAAATAAETGVARIPDVVPTDSILLPEVDCVGPDQHSAKERKRSSHKKGSSKRSKKRHNKKGSRGSKNRKSRRKRRGKKSKDGKKGPESEQGDEKEAEAKDAESSESASLSDRISGTVSGVFSSGVSGFLRYLGLGDKFKFLDMFIRMFSGLVLPDAELAGMYDQLINICDLSYAQHMKARKVAEMQAPAIIAGDLHGQMYDLLHLFAATSADGRLPWTTNKYIFCGDYVDRGKYSLQLILFLMLVKLRHDDRIILLRGNHEDAYVNRTYGLYEELKRIFPEDKANKLYHRLNRVFNCMPPCALLSEKIVVVHGGFPKPEDIPSRVQHLRDLHNELPVECANPRGDKILEALMWSDPLHGQPGFTPNSARNAGSYFGEDATNAFCKRFGIDLIVRGHVCPKMGAEACHAGKVVTVFSAANYANGENLGATMHVAADLTCTFRITRNIDDKVEGGWRVWFKDFYTFAANNYYIITHGIYKPNEEKKAPTPAVVDEDLTVVRTARCKTPVPAETPAEAPKEAPQAPAAKAH